MVEGQDRQFDGTEVDQVHQLVSVPRLKGAFKAEKPERSILTLH